MHRQCSWCTSPGFFWQRASSQICSIHTAANLESCALVTHTTDIYSEACIAVSPAHAQVRLNSQYLIGFQKWQLNTVGLQLTGTLMSLQKGPSVAPISSTRIIDLLVSSYYKYNTQLATHTFYLALFLCVGVCSQMCDCTCAHTHTHTHMHPTTTTTTTTISMTLNSATGLDPAWAGSMQ